MVTVLALSDTRRGAPEAQALYEESADSIRRREEHADARRAAGGMLDRPEKRPTKKQRRQIHRFKQDV
jgi:ribosome-associated heat shock protein Hsp15